MCVCPFPPGGMIVTAVDGKRDELMEILLGARSQRLGASATSLPATRATPVPCGWVTTEV
jgi:hypothetical protein